MNFSKTFAPLLLVLVVLLIAELVVRVFFAQNMSGRFEYGYHPTAGWVVEDDTVRLVRAGGRRFRPQEFKSHKDPHSLRIFTIGDSVPRGPSLDDAYPAQLETVLKETSISSESFNLGVAGYGARRNALVVDEAIKHRPDVIVYHLNDSNEFEDEREYRRSQEFAGWHPEAWAMKSLFFRRLYELRTEKIFWELIPRDVRRMEMVNDADAEVKAAQKQGMRAEWNQRLELETLDSLKQILDANIQLVVIVQCRLVREKGNPDDLGYLEDGYNGTLARKLAQQLQGRPVEFIYMLEIFNGEEEFTSSTGEIYRSSDYFNDRPLGKFFSDSAHLTDEGHELIARSIAARLQK